MFHEPRGIWKKTFAYVLANQCVQNGFSMAIGNKNKWDSCGLSTWVDKIEDSAYQA